ncbi:MAG: nucleotide exchange factor GrpE [Parasporobacterium sp.]|nr:nucleotide exchange factor GrpE [Parasporobacterium sp.]
MNTPGLWIADNCAYITYSIGSGNIQQKISLTNNVNRKERLGNVMYFADIISRLSDVIFPAGSDRCLLVAMPSGSLRIDHMKLQDACERLGIRIKRMPCENSMAALSIAYKFKPEEELFFAATCIEGSSEISLYGYENGIVEKYCSFLDPESDPEEYQKFTDIVKAGTLKAGRLYYIGEREFGRKTAEFLRKHIPGIRDYQAGYEAITEGISIQLGKMEGMPGTESILMLDTAGPSDLFARVNHEWANIINGDTSIPAFNNKVFDVDDNSRELDIRIYEKSGSSVRQISRKTFGGTETAKLLKEKQVGIRFNLDAAGILTVTVLDKAGNKRAEYTAKPVEVILNNQGNSSAAPDENIREHVDEVMTGKTPEELLEEIMPVMDNLYYALEYSTDAEGTLGEGIRKIYAQAEAVLLKNDVELVGIKGEKFDVSIHTAISHMSDADMPENTVYKVSQRGYRYKGKLIRPASVIVVN